MKMGTHQFDIWAVRTEWVRDARFALSRAQMRDPVDPGNRMVTDADDSAARDEFV
jgi:hypothetical protein